MSPALSREINWLRFPVLELSNFVVVATRFSLPAPLIVNRRSPTAKNRMIWTRFRTRICAVFVNVT